MKKRWLPEWVTEYRDRHGKPRYRFRRKGFATYSFKSAPGAEAFMQEYRACVAGVTAEPIAPGAERIKPGTFDDLVSRYYRSPDFLDPGDRTRAVYRGVIERWRTKYGKAMVRDLEARHVEAWMTDLLPHRTAANMLRKRLQALMKFAVRIGMATTNPIVATRPFKIKSDGFHSWTDEEIAQFEATYPIGTTARLALDLMLWTGQRPGDARLLGPQHVRSKRLHVVQEKGQGEVIVSIPILPPLAESILATQSGALVFIMSAHGKPYSKKGFGNKMREWCDKAALPLCTAHGLRKAAARRFAEAGCSNQQIKSWTGHRTESEVTRYTAAASQIGLSDSAAEMLMANLAERFANEARNQLKREAK